jgi:glycosyltransferase involved in cell wall biosynthesis
MELPAISSLFKTNGDTPRPHGSLDGPSYGTARGWAFDPANPDAHVSIDLTINGAPFVTVVANQHRADLQAAGFGKGDHSFAIPFDPKYLDGIMHKLEGRITGTDIVLANSPLDFSHSDPPENGEVPATRRPMPRQTKNPKRQGVPDVQAAPDSALGGVSVVIPTYNRGASLEETLRLCLEATGGAAVEFVVIDDGSTDDTPQRLQRLAAEFPQIRFASIPNGGPGQARNVGVRMATHEIVLFQGDDIRPACEGFYLHHLNAHRQLPSLGVAVLGKIIWPNQGSDPVNFVMSHVQGLGENQFGYYHLIPYSWLDWRFFYTSNISFKKSVVNDWAQNGFNPGFRAAAWEDAELAYRLFKQYQGGFRILYTPASVATHHHPYSVRQFVERQISVGLTAKTFLEFHPEVAKMIGVVKLQKVLASEPKGPSQTDDFISMIEGLKAWPKVIEERYSLGSQNWHADLLSAVFELCYLQGFVMAHTNPNANYAGAYAYILERFQERMAASASYEAFGRFPSFTLT